MDFFRNNGSNSSDHPCNEMLLEAVGNNDIEEVERLLKHPNLNLNYNVGNFNPALFISLHIRSDAIFISLLNAGLDVNISNHLKETPLQTTIKYFLPLNFAHELIKRGADIETVDNCGRTVLYNAVLNRYGEAVCMLLYYGADVNATCSNNMTPFMCALKTNLVEISKILFNYCNDFSCVNFKGSTALHFATLWGNPIAVDILKAGAEENENGDSLLEYSVGYNTAEVFKLIWSKFKEKIHCDDGFLITYLIDCNFSNSEWLNCFHLLLKSPIAFERFFQGVYAANNVLMQHLLRVLYKRKIELKDRLALIYLFLSFGMKVNVEDINLAYLLYGFNEELEAFIYTFNNEHAFERNHFLPLPRFIFVLEDDYQIEIISDKFKYYLYCDDFTEAVGGEMEQDVILWTLGFFSLPYPRTQAIKLLLHNYFKDHQRIIEKLDAIPEVPSLFELCRNETRKLITKSYNVRKSYQFHDIVKKLNLPLSIRDCIRFKTPVY